MKTLIRKILKEETSNKFINKVLKWVKEPYLKNIEGLGLTKDEYKLVLSKIFNQSVTIKGRSVYDQNGKLIYRETSTGYWEKYEYDTNGNLIYRENSYGDWEKREYDANDNEIYFEDSDGYIEDKR